MKLIVPGFYICFDRRIYHCIVNLPSIETELRFLFTVSSCRHHFFLPCKLAFLVIGPDCEACVALLKGLLWKGSLSDVSGEDTISRTNISSSRKCEGFRTCGLTIAIGECTVRFEFCLYTFRPHDEGAGDPAEMH